MNDERQNTGIVKASGWIKENATALAPLIPPNHDQREFLNGAMMCLEENPKLKTALQEAKGRSSLLSALQRAARVGLPLDPMSGYAGLIPYDGKIRYQIFKEGLIELALRNGQLSEFRTRVIYENDSLTLGETEKGDTYNYQQAITNPGKPIGYLAIGRLPNGTVRTHYMTVDQINAWRDKYAMKDSNGNLSGPLWKKFFDGAAQKTVARQLLMKLKIATPNDDYDADREVEIEIVKRGTSAADVKADLAARMNPEPPAEPDRKEGGARWDGDDAPIGEPEPGDLI